MNPHFPNGEPPKTLQEALDMALQVPWGEAAHATLSPDQLWSYLGVEGSARRLFEMRPNGESHYAAHCKLAETLATAYFNASQLEAKTPKYDAPSLLNTAAGIMAERGKQYDQDGGERSMARTVQAFNAVVGREALSETEGWLFMLLLKAVRANQNTAVAHRDSYEDAIAYAALMAESALNTNRSEGP